MPMVPFYTRCLETAAREARSLYVGKGQSLPVGQYVFTEFYCDEPDCDCRRVILHVHPPEDLNEVLASITYGWETPAYYQAWSHGDIELAEEMAGATLELFDQQGLHASELLTLTKDFLLADPVYIDRLKRHYAEFKATPPDIGEAKKRSKRLIERLRPPGGSRKSR